MTDDRFDEGGSRLAKGEPRIADGDAPARPVDDMEPVGDATPDEGERVTDAVEGLVADAQEDDATPPDDGSIAKPAHFTAFREEKGWSVNEVAGRLRMQVRQIEAIEAGRWDDLPGTAFVRAAIRSYARLLDRDPGRLLATVAQLDTGADLRSPHRTPVAISPTGSLDESSGIGRWGLALLGLIAVIAIAFYFAPSTDLRWPSQWFDGEGGSSLGDNPPVAATPPSPGATPAPARDGSTSAGSPSDDAVAAAARAANELLASQSARREPDADPSARASGDATRSAASAGASGPAGAAAGTSPEPEDAEEAARSEPSAPDRAPALASPASPAAGAPTRMGADTGAPSTATTAASTGEAGRGDAPASEASTPSTPAPRADASASASSLLMVFDAECWVEVSDAQGKRLVYGLQKPRTSLSLDVPGPVSVLVGNADAVTMTRGGEPVDVRSQARDGVAKLRLQ